LRAYAGEVETARRKHRVPRAKMARIHAGKPLMTKRASFGYDWADERRKDGRLARDRMVENPQAAPVLRQIWQMTYDGATQREIARTLTTEQVPLPSGKIGTWDPTTIGYLLRNGIHWGELEGLRKMSVPVDKAVRAH